MTQKPQTPTTRAGFQARLTKPEACRHDCTHTQKGAFKAHMTDEPHVFFRLLVCRTQGFDSPDVFAVFSHAAIGREETAPS